MDEAISIKEENLILAKDQNQDFFIDPDAIKGVNEAGQLTDLIKPKQEEIIAQYWQHQYKKVALIGLISSGILLSIVIQESDFFNIIFGTMGDFLFSIPAQLGFKMPSVPFL